MSEKEEERRTRLPVGDWGGVQVRPGESRDVMLAVSESYAGLTVEIPIHVRRAEREGPTVFVTAALHGDEINGTGAVRHLIENESVALERGALVLVPVLNMLAFDRHSRYLPDRRDLNRSFPGSPTGSLASRMAYTIFNEIVTRCDYGIDLHTAAVRRTNYPNVRGDLRDESVRGLAVHFGSDVVVDSKGPRNSFRRSACAAGCPTIMFEGGEVWKVEPGIVATAVRGVTNVLQGLDMLPGEPERPPFQLEVKKTKWIRAERGGFLQFHVAPGDIVERDQPLATNTTILGREHRMLSAPFAGVVLGMSTLPATSPGEPVCHLGRLPKGAKPDRLRAQRARRAGLEERVVEELSANVLVVDRAPNGFRGRP